MTQEREWYLHGYGWYTDSQVQSICQRYGWKKEMSVVIGVEGIPIGWRDGHTPSKYTHVTFPLVSIPL